MGRALFGLVFVAAAWAGIVILRPTVCRWIHKNRPVNDLVTKEASSLAALYRDSGGYPQPIRTQLQGKLRDYAREAIAVSRPAQRRGVEPKGEPELITRTLTLFATIEAPAACRRAPKILRTPNAPILP